MVVHGWLCVCGLCSCVERGSGADATIGRRGMVRVAGGAEEVGGRGGGGRDLLTETTVPISQTGVLNPEPL